MASATSVDTSDPAGPDEEESALHPETDAVKTSAAMDTQEIKVSTRPRTEDFNNGSGEDTGDS
ncbi:hypothetical protein [Actinomyces qiguomingii]|uniref:hypothetical protein n=1 Tax=Actinomyces qiguomingii TaxID=2057800 RepID=UPI001E4189DC|nr:hypothetical protein [Actinomyces qiguomingii]